MATITRPQEVPNSAERERWNYVTSKTVCNVLKYCSLSGFCVVVVNKCTIWALCYLLYSSCYDRTLPSDLGA